MNKQAIDIKVEQWKRKVCKENEIKSSNKLISIFRKEAVFERYWVYIFRYNNKVIDTLRIDTNEKN